MSVASASRLHRWAIILSAYRYDIRYKRGQDNPVADALSRLPMPAKSTGIDISTNLINMFKDDQEIPISHEDVAKQTKLDLVLTKVKELILTGWSNSVKNINFQPFFNRRHELSVEKGCVVWGNRVVIPLILQRNILELLHQQHPGMVRMKQLARSYLWWPGLDKEIEDEVRQCEQCQRYQRNNPEDKNYTGWPKMQNNWYRLHTDFFHFMGNNYLLIVDSTSKWIDIYLMKSCDAESVFDKLRIAFGTFGLPHQLVSDNGPPFNSFRYIRLCKCNGIEPLNSPVYYPKANGTAERNVETVKQNFKKSLENKILSVTEIHRHIQNFLFVYRNTPNSVTQISPANLLLKQSPRTILSQIKPKFGDSDVLVNKKIVQNYNSFIFAAQETVLVKFNSKTWEKAKVVRPLSSNRYLVEINGKMKELHKQQMKKYYASKERQFVGLEISEVTKIPTATPVTETLSAPQETTSTTSSSSTPLETPSIITTEEPSSTSTASTEATVVGPAKRVRRPPDRLAY